MLTVLTETINEWMAVARLYPLLFFTTALLNWSMGWAYGRIRLRKDLETRLARMTKKFNNAHLAARTYREELEERAEKEE